MNNEEIKTLMKSKEPYIILRNKILDNPFRFFSPTARKKLANIDSKLDEIDLRIYDLQSKNIPKLEELEQMIANANNMVSKIKV